VPQKGVRVLGLNTSYNKHLRVRLMAFSSVLAVMLLLASMHLSSYANTTQNAQVDTLSLVKTQQNFSSVKEANCGNRIKNYSVLVPYGNSPWNTPACNISLFNNDSNLALEYGNRMFNYGSAWDASWSSEQRAVNKSKFQTQFGLAGDDKDYSTPIYYSSQATRTIKIKTCDQENCLPSNLDKSNCWDRQDLMCMVPDREIPWNDDWRAAGDWNPDAVRGNDREMVIVDESSGAVYSLWMVDRSGAACAVRSIWYNLAGKDADNRLCVANAGVIRDSTKNIADYRSYDEGVYAGTGMGIQDSAMLVTAQEVGAGEIKHALIMEAFNTMFGPECTKEQLATNDYNIIGRQCGFTVAPGTRFEWRNSPNVERSNRPGGHQTCADIANRVADNSTGQTFREYMTLDKMIPEGMRFRLTLTDAEIETWLNSRAASDPEYGVGKPKRNTAKIFAVALRDYGWHVGDTTCFGNGFTTAGAANPMARVQWEKLGIKDASSQNLLMGLVKENTIVALEPPTVTCVDGSKTKYICSWLDSKNNFSGATVDPVAKAPATTPVTTPVTKAPPVTTPVTTPVTKAPPVTTPVTTPVTKAPPVTTPVTTPVPKGPSQIKDTIAPIMPVKFYKAELIYNIFQFEACSWRTYCKIALSWNNANDNMGVAYYKLVKQVNGKSSTYIYPRVSKIHFDTNFNLGYEYNYSVYAIDAAGNVSAPLTIKVVPQCVLSVCGLIKSTK
jgi:hypothetical protein